MSLKITLLINLINDILGYLALDRLTISMYYLILKICYIKIINNFLRKIYDLSRIFHALCVSA